MTTIDLLALITVLASLSAIMQGVVAVLAIVESDDPGIRGLALAAFVIAVLMLFIAFSAGHISHSLTALGWQP